MCILQSLQRYLSAVQSLISFLNNSSNLAFLIALGTNSQICEARKAKKTAFPYYFQFNCICIQFQRNSLYLPFIGRISS